MTAVDHDPRPATSERDAELMRRAIELARNGLYTTDPNPRVGCVIVQGDRIVGQGWHMRTGDLHAERVALADAGEAARGATVYVSLEPCNHTGRTAPCSDALIAAGVARVVCAMRDPNPNVAGGGIDALERAGIAVADGLLEREARALNPGYVSRAVRGRPFVRSKLAVSLDGRTALANGQSQWITGEAARADVHRWRARASAVVTGIDTVLADDPALDARLGDTTIVVHQPARVVIDSRLRVPLDAKTLTLPGERIVFTASGDSDKVAALAARGTTIEQVGRDVDGHCDLAEVMRRLAALELNEVWVEAGAGLNAGLLEAGLIDELVVYVAPVLLGDRARGMFDLGELTALVDAPRLELVETEIVGDDLRIVARPISLASES